MKDWIMDINRLENNSLVFYFLSMFNISSIYYRGNEYIILKECNTMNENEFILKLKENNIEY